MSTTYAATATREGRWWVVTVPEISGVTQARRLPEARRAATELVAVTLDVDDDEVEIDLAVTGVGDIDVATELAAILEVREAAAALEAEASNRASDLARRLTATGLPLRDVGTLLGVSHQRAHQVVHDRVRPTAFTVCRVDAGEELDAALPHPDSSYLLLRRSPPVEVESLEHDDDRVRRRRNTG